MNNTKKISVRHAKGPFAMAFVYCCTSGAILASIIFSLLLFLSIDDNLLMKVLFGSLAVIFEVGKFFAWYEFGERMARRKALASLSAFLFYAVLAAISIGGSIGGINSATNTAQRHVDVVQNKIAAYDLQISGLAKQIELNNIAAEKYITLNRIATGVSRIQKENSLLRKQQLELTMQKNNIPVASQGSILGLIGGIAAALNINAVDAQLSLVIFLSILLDLFAAFFVGLIGEELRFIRSLAANKKRIEHHQAQKEAQQLSDPQSVQFYGTAPDSKDSHAEVLFQKAVDILHKGDIRCSKKAIAHSLEISSEEVNQIFSGLLEKGFVSQKANRHFNWHGQPT